MHLVLVGISHRTAPVELRERIDFQARGLEASHRALAARSELREAVAVLRNSCAARSALPQSSLTAAGRGGLPQDPEASVPALYLADRDAFPAASSANRASGRRMAAEVSQLRLAVHCN